MKRNMFIVPEWFVRVLPLADPSGQAEAQSGSKRAFVQVTSHPGYAYQQLWITARNTLALMLLFWGLAALLRRLAGTGAGTFAPHGTAGAESGRRRDHTLE